MFQNEVGVLFDYLYLCCKTLVILSWLMCVISKWNLFKHIRQSNCKYCSRWHTCAWDNASCICYTHPLRIKSVVNPWMSEYFRAKLCIKPKLTSLPEQSLFLISNQIKGLRDQTSTFDKGLRDKRLVQGQSWPVSTKSLFSVLARSLDTLLHRPFVIGISILYYVRQMKIHVSFYVFY